MEVWGIILIFLIVAISNSGGASGAANIISVMLIFFGMKMDQAVSTSSFVAVVATILRFLILGSTL